MNKEWQHHYILAAVVVIAISAKPSIWEGSKARGQEPVEWCLTQQHWDTQGFGQVSGAGCGFGPCDTPSVRDSFIPAGELTPIVWIRVRLNIFCNTNESSCVELQPDINTQLAELNEDFAPHRIQFTVNTHLISDSTYRDLSDPEISAMKAAYSANPAHQLNIYVVNYIQPGGLAILPWDPAALTYLGGIIMDDDVFGPGLNILTHEVGHSLGLWHTHHGVSEVAPCSACYERADGVEGDITGDFASDTPATPTNFDNCADAPGTDLCSDPPTPWAPTQPANFMGYAPDSCRNLFTVQQAGRKHCWIHHVLTGWIACTTNQACDDANQCTVDLCVQGICQHNSSTTEGQGLTCRDGVDNDCDGFLDCDDVENCASNAACFCFDLDGEQGSSPLVCVDWTEADPPAIDVNFALDLTDAANPGVELRTGNDGWKVWSQVSRTNYTPADLGSLKVNPNLLTQPPENFSVTIAHGDLPGAGNVVSMALVKAGWTGQSNLSGGSIEELAGDLVLQQSGGQGGVATLTIGGFLFGDVTIPRVNRFEVNGRVAGGSRITILDFVGDKRADFNYGLDFAGDLSLPNGLPTGAHVSIYGLLTNSASIDLNAQALAGSISLGGGTAGLSSINTGPLTGRIIGVYGNVNGTLQINGVMSGDICAPNFSASSPLPSNVTIGCGIGTQGTICGDEPACPSGNILSASPPHGTRDGRQPYPAGVHGMPVALSERQGIGSPNPDARPEDKITMTLNNSGLRAISHDCWTLCETNTEPVDTGTSPLNANKFTCVKETATAGNAYEIRLERPISARNWTTLKYKEGSQKIAYASLPGNINGDNYTNSIDLLRRIDCMNGITSQCGTTVYTQDLDHSGAFILASDYAYTWVQLWNGEGRFIAWQNQMLPPNSCQSGGGGGPGGGNCTSADCGEDPGPMAMGMAGGSGEEGFSEGEAIGDDPAEMSLAEENAVFADWVVSFLAAADPQGSEALEIFDSSIGLIAQWCLDHFTAVERAALVARITDPSLSFESGAGAEAAGEVADALE